MATENPEKREKWLIRAAEQGYMPAQAALADWYLLHAQPELAKPWLQKTAMDDMQSAFKYGRLLWDEIIVTTPRYLFSAPLRKVIN